jgi:hypothetical protein
VKIQAFEENFMLSAAIQGDIKKLEVPVHKVDLDRDQWRTWTGQRESLGTPPDLSRSSALHSG